MLLQYLNVNISVYFLTVGFWGWVQKPYHPLVRMAKIADPLHGNYLPMHHLIGRSLLCFSSKTSTVERP